MKKDYYEILGVPKDSALQDIKKAYRKFALKFHPDRVEESKKKAAEEKFKEITEAYGVLSDPKKRQMYDQYGHAGIDQNFTTDDIFKGADFSSIFEGGGLGDIFSQFFGDSGADIFGGGGQRRSRRQQRGRDIQYEVDITLEEAYKGVNKSITFPRNEFCTDCKGTGAKKGTALTTCQTCKGQGAVMTSSGFFRMQQTCPECQGKGQIIKDYCPQCNGKGALRITKKIQVDIPAGVDNNSRLRLQGQGEVGAGGAGDLYVYIHVLDHNVFQRDGNDIYMQQPVSFVKAALGGEVSVSTLNSAVSMKVPAGTQSGKVFRLKGKGMVDLHTKVHGDQYVKVMINVPTKLSVTQRKLLEDFAQESGEAVEPPLVDSLKEKIKKVFK